MRKALGYICFLMIVVLVVPATATDEAPFTITISTPQGTFRTGQAIPLYLKFTNITRDERFLTSSRSDVIVPDRLNPSDAEAYITEKDRIRATNESSPGNAENTNQIIVVRADGHPVPETEYGLHLNDPIEACLGGCSIFEQIPAGSSRMDSTLLNKLYDMSEPGVYLVHVEHKVTPMEQGAVATSLDESADVAGSEQQEGQSQQVVIKSNPISLTVY